MPPRDCITNDIPSLHCGVMSKCVWFVINKYKEDRFPSVASLNDMGQNPRHRIPFLLPVLNRLYRIDDSRNLFFKGL